MGFTARTTGFLAAGLVSLGIGLERFTNALLVDGLTSYTSTRVITAVACTTAGGLLLAVASVALLNPRRRAHTRKSRGDRART